MYRTHIGPVFGSKPVASITTADVTGFRAQLVGTVFKARASSSGSKPTAHVYAFAKDGEAHCRNPQAHLGYRAGRSSHRRATLLLRAVGTQPSAERCLRRQGTLQAPSADRQPSSVVSRLDRSQRLARPGQRHLRAGCAVRSAYRRSGLRATGSAGCRTSRCPTSPARLAAIRMCAPPSAKTVSGPTAHPRVRPSTDRVVPLAPWLADELRDYLTSVHPFSATNARASTSRTHRCFPGRRNRYAFDWAKPVVVDNLYEQLFRSLPARLGPRHQYVSRLAAQLRHDESVALASTTCRCQSGWGTPVSYSR